MKTAIIRNWLSLVIFFVTGALLPGGCQSPETSKPAPTPPAATVMTVRPAVPAEKPTPAPENKCGPSLASQTYPAGDVIRLEVKTPNQVLLNEPFDYTLKVTNVSDMAVTDVVVTERLPKSFTFQKSDPSAKTDESRLDWTLDSMAPKSTWEIKVVGVATNTDCLKHCATVSFLVPTCAVVEVLEPKLMLIKNAPKEAVLCDPIPVAFIVANNGNGPLEGVKIVDKLPTGLKTTDGQSELVFDAGTLAAGQSKQFSAVLRASKVGPYVHKAVATARNGLKSEAASSTVIRQPALAIAKTGPEKLYISQLATYEITVTNKGDAPAVDTVVEETIPQGVRAIRPSSGGTVSGLKVAWRLGTLAPNTSQKVSVTYVPVAEGTLANTATATAVCVDSVTAFAQTTVVGIAAIQLEVVDVNDPVQLGTQTTYLITATNQGSIASTNVAITCTLEDNEQYLSSTGATSAVVEGNIIRFDSLPILAPRSKATWWVVVKAVKPGDVRFTVNMRTAELQRPVEETEATQIYQ